MLKLKYHIPLTTAALLALTATVNAQTPGTEAAGALATTSPAAALANDPNGASRQAEATEPVTAAETAATAETSPPITNDSVRGDAVLAMLDQKSCEAMNQASGPDAKGSEEGGYPTVNTTNLIDPDNYTKISGYPIGDRGAPCNPGYFRYDALGAGNYTHTEYESFDQTRHGYLGRSAPRKFNSLNASVPLSVTANGFSLGNSAEIKTSEQQGLYSNMFDGPALQLTSTRPFTTTHTARISYGVLSAWKDSQGHNYQLMLLPGHQGQAKLCWNTNVDKVMRLSCTTWTAPQNWKRGERLNIAGKYIIDDRTPYGEQGLIYFTNK